MHFLVFQHVAVEHPGYFRELWRKAGITWTAVELDEGEPIPSDLAAYDALVAMGGPMDTWETERHPWLVPELEAIRSFVSDHGRPFLGVCLGHQLLASALGGTVAPGSTSEVGPCPVDLTAEGKADPLLRGLPSPLITFQWHSAEVKTAPAGSVVLAETELCHVQAFRWRDRAYGLQFHAEITDETIDDWRGIPAYAQSLEATLGPGAGDRLAAEIPELLAQLNATAAALNDNFLAIVRG